MGDRANLGIIELDGSATVTHLQWSSDRLRYLLKNSYGSEERARALIALGDLSELGESLEFKPDAECPRAAADGFTMAYHRDRGDELEPNIYKSFHDDYKVPSDVERVYIFDVRKGRWYDYKTLRVAYLNSVK